MSLQLIFNVLSTGTFASANYPPCLILIIAIYLKGKMLVCVK